MSGSDNDKVGYKKPPLHSRFQPGRSGNPRGRPKKAASVGFELVVELNRKVTVRENGVEQTMPKAAALAKSLVAHSQSLANDLAGKVGQLLQSPLFAEIFPGFELMEGREAMADFRTSKAGGFRAGSFDTGITGRGADLLLIDDALSAHDAGSAAARNFVCNTFDNMLATRLNDPKTGAIVSMSHRLHEGDLTGHLIKQESEHLCLPFEATEDEEYACKGIVFRRRAGEVLQPGRVSVDDIRKMGLAAHVYATQYQQVPQAMGSGILSEKHFPYVETCPTGGETIVSWDIASSTREGSSYSVGLVFQVHQDVAYLKHILRERLDMHPSRSVHFACMRPLASRPISSNGAWDLTGIGAEGRRRQGARYQGWSGLERGPSQCRSQQDLRQLCAIG